MERMTEHRGKETIIVDMGKHHESAIRRLAAIEDILGDEYDLDRLRELMEADKAGRCVVLPCKEGDKLKKDGFEFEADHWNIILTSFAKDDSVKTGERLMLFGVKEAEQALERMKKNG